MSDLTTDTISRYRPKARRRIIIDNEEWIPRKDFAEDDLGIVDRTAARMNFETMYVSGIAYIPRGKSLREMAAKAQRRNEPAKRRRGG